MSDFWANYHETTVPYLTATEKHELASSHTRFMVGAIAPRSGRYGDEWHLTINYGAGNMILSLASNPIRDSMMRAIRDHFANGGESFAAILEFVSSENGSYYRLAQIPRD